MNEQIISFETAKLLKNILEPKIGDYGYFFVYHEDENDFSTEPERIQVNPNDYLPVLSQSNTQKLLREHYNCHVEVQHHFTAKDRYGDNYFVMIYMPNEKNIDTCVYHRESGKGIPSYEEALEHGLYNALLLLN